MSSQRGLASVKLSLCVYSVENAAIQIFEKRVDQAENMQCGYLSFLYVWTKKRWNEWN